MDKQKFYAGIKNIIYRKFNELEEIERDKGNYVYLRYKNEEFTQILIEKKSGNVHYSYRVADKIYKMIRLERADFEVLLSTWVEDTFQIKVNHIAMSDLFDFFRG